MRKTKRIAALCAAMAAAALCSLSATADSTRKVDITVDVTKDRKAISPYIYGINSEQWNKEVSATAIRAGGNRFTAYNWETNASNAGADMNHINDTYFSTLTGKKFDDKPGSVALYLSERCTEMGAYSLMTIPMAGYVSADTKGAVKEDEVQSAARFNKSEPAKGSEFSLTPDLNDGVVYQDEFVNYLVQTLGDASTETGIKGYSLDNEPSLWRSTHPRVHPEKTGCKEIIDVSVATAKAIKAVDPTAEVFGPALFGYGAFDSFGNPDDWSDIKADNGYEWFVDYYLDEMKKAEDANGQRLIDVFDVHYYTEAKGACGKRSCKHYSDADCVAARLNSTRSLWDADYKEDSWITKDAGAKFFPLLPKLRASIDKYYPGTKLGITEYDFGAAYDISGGIAEADVLGVFAQNEVYFATLFSMDSKYQLTAIDLYTNYDGKGSGFGDTLVSCQSGDIETSTAYASVDEGSNDVVKLVITNKAFEDNTEAAIKISGGSEYKYAHLYSMNKMAPKVFDLGEGKDKLTLSGDTVTLTMEPETVSMLVLSKDEIAEAPDPETSGADPEAASAADKDTSEEKSDTPIGLIVGGICAGAAALAAAVFFIIRKKK